MFGRRHLLIKFVFCCYFNLITFAGPNDVVVKNGVDSIANFYTVIFFSSLGP